MNAKATKAFEEAQQGGDTPQIEYALRRIGGPERLANRLDDFTRAYNESPIVDADENETFYQNILVRAHEPKDGVR